MISRSRTVTAYLIIVLAVSLLIGLPMYLFPSVMSSGFWPYSMKPLATRMFASMFLAVALAMTLALWESNWESVKILFIQGTPMYGLILLAALMNFPKLQLTIAGTIAWLALFSALTLGSLFIFLERSIRAKKETDSTHMRTPIHRGLKYSLLLHTIIVVAFGLQMLIVPDVALNFWPWTLPSIIMQGLGGLFIGITVGTGWAYTQKSLERVKIALPAYTTFSTLVLLAVAIDWNVITTESPSTQVTLLWLVLYAYTALYALYYYLRQSSNI